MLAAVLAAVVAASSGQPAGEGKPVVLVMTNPRASGAGFADSLRIQLVTSGTVRSGPVLSRGKLADKLLRARTLAVQEGARLVVWIERGRARQRSEYVLYVVTPTKRTRGVELFRIRARPGPDVDRTLALKVSDVLDALIAGKPVTAAVRVDSPPPLYRPPARTRWSAAVLGTGRLGDGTPSAQAAFGVRGGYQLDWPRWAFNAGVDVASDFGVSEIGSDGQVSTRELVTGAFAAMVRKLGVVSLGGELRTRLRLVFASGRTPMNNTGDRVVVLPTLGASVVTRVRVSPRMNLVLGVGGEVATRRRKLSVNGVEVIDLGRWGGQAQLGLQILLP